MGIFKMILAFLDLEATLLLFLAWRETKSETAKLAGGTLCLLFVANMILLWI